MSTNNKPYDRDKDGYMRLIPRIHTTVTCSSIHKGNDSCDFWKARCKELEKQIDELQKDNQELVEIIQQQTELLESRGDKIESGVQLRLMEMEEDRTSEPPGRLVPIDEPNDEFETPEFDHGFGVSFGGGKDVKAYRLDDPKGPLIPKRKFAGGIVEIQPGRGFRVGLRWKGIE